MNEAQQKKNEGTAAKVIGILLVLGLIAGIWAGCSALMGSSHTTCCQKCGQEAKVIEEDEYSYKVMCDEPYCKAFYTVYHPWTDEDAYRK